nr:feruloyl CoA ortho-hydroxylase 1-like [Ipomoea trifida]
MVDNNWFIKLTGNAFDMATELRDFQSLAYKPCPTNTVTRQRRGSPVWTSFPTTPFRSLTSQTGRTQRWLSLFVTPPRIGVSSRNHEISLEMLEKDKAATYRFFKEPVEEKKKYSKENSATSHVRYNTSFIP